MTEKKPRLVVLSSIIVILVLVVSLVTLFYYYEDRIEGLMYERTLVAEYCSSCFENAEEDECSHMEYPQHRWSLNEGRWICDE